MFIEDSLFNDKKFSSKLKREFVRRGNRGRYEFFYKGKFVKINGK